jgi:hypothetical protein
MEERTIYKFRLKDMSMIFDEEVDYKVLLTEVLGYNNRWVGRRKRFKKFAKEALFMIEELKHTDPKTVLWDEACPIQKPQSIDNISFKAMLSINSLKNSDLKIPELILETIAIVCYESNNSDKLNTESGRYERFKNRVSNQPMLYMLGLFNWIDKSLEESELQWDKLFMSVRVVDEDYENAGGAKMNQFNVINTIKNLCQEFNVTEQDAWNLSYAMTQTSSLSKATSSFIMKEMEKIKEARMKRERNQK